MKLKKKTKPGECKIVRCIRDENGSGFCDRHEKEWATCDKPVPTTPSKDPVYDAGMRAGLAQADVEIAHEAVAIDVQKEVESHAGTIQEYAALVPQMTITSDDDMDLANEILAEIKSKIKGLEDRRKTVSKPLNDALKTYNAWFKGPLDMLKKVESQIKAKISEAVLATRQAQDAALQMVEASGGEAVTEVLAVAHGEQLVTQPNNVSIIEKWDLEITDEKAVPRDFCDPNPRRLLAYAQATNGAVVPGVRFFKRQEVRQRASR